MIGRGYELITLAVVLLLLFGAKQLPNSARALGKSMRILKAETRAMREEDGGAPKSEADR